MKTLLHPRDGASKGAALMIVLGFVVLMTGLALAYMSRSTTDRQLAQSSHNDTSGDLLARTALDIVVGDFKQELLDHPTVTTGNIQPTRYGDASIPNLIRRSYNGDPTNRTSNVSSATASANGRSISTARWNSHYLVPRGNPGSTAIDSSPVPSFTAPDWVLVTAQGPNSVPAPSAVIGRYAFAVYDEGGLLDLSMAGYPSWSGAPSAVCSPAPTPWLVNVGRKGIMAFADLTALGLSAPQVDNIVGWRNYAMTQRTPPASFGSFSYAGETNCTKQDWYGSYLLYFGDPPFSIESLSDKLLASTFPFTSVAAYVSSNRTDQSLMTRQQLLKLQRALDNPPGQFSQNVLQYMGTFSRERNRPAPDWPHLNETGESSVLSEGRFNLNNLALVIPNPLDCQLPHGKKVGWQTGKNRNHICGTPDSIIELFGLAWVISTQSQIPGYWKYINHTGPNPPGGPDPDPHSIICFREGSLQKDFFQVLHYALNLGRNQTDRCGGIGQQARTFGIGASLIDQYDSGADCVTNQPINWGPGCDLDSHVNSQYRTHTTAIKYGQGGTNVTFAYGMELDNSVDPVNGDRRCGEGTNDPHRPSPAPPPITSPSPNQTIVVNHAFSNVGELGYGIDTSTLATPGPSPTPACAPTQGPTAMPTLDFSSPDFPDAPMLDFFSYNPISSAYPRAGIVNLYTKNAPVLAAIIARTLQTDAAGNVTPNPTPVVSASDAMTAANAIVAETQAVLLGSATWPVRQTDMTRAIAARLAEKGGTAISGSWTKEQRQSIARALAEVGQTRTWNLFIDVIAQTGKYKPNAPDLTGSNFVIEGEKRYWLHIALGRDLVHTDGTPCLPGESGCQVDVLGTQLEEVVE